MLFWCDYRVVQVSLKGQRKITLTLRVTLTPTVTCDFDPMPILALGAGEIAKIHQPLFAQKLFGWIYGPSPE